MPGFRKGKVPARIIEARARPRRGARAGRQRRHPHEVQRGRHLGRGRHAARAAARSRSPRSPTASASRSPPRSTSGRRSTCRSSSSLDGHGRRRRGHRRATSTSSWTTCARGSAPSPGSSAPPRRATSSPIDLAASVDGEAVEEAQTSGLSYQVGQGGLHRRHRRGDHRAVRGRVGDVHHRARRRGSTTARREVTVTVTAVKERELPDADDEFAQLASEFDTLEELTADLRSRLGRVRQMEQLTQARDKVLDALLRRPRSRCPRASSSRRSIRGCTTRSTRSTTTRQFAEFLEEKGKTREEFDTEAREDAEKSVRARLVLDKLADDQEVVGEARELTERIVFQAQQYQMPPEEFVKRIQEAGQLGAIYADVRRSKALSRRSARPRSPTLRRRRLSTMAGRGPRRGARSRAPTRAPPRMSRTTRTPPRKRRNREARGRGDCGSAS